MTPDEALRWSDYVLDVTLDSPCFCPVEDDGSVVIGMSLIYERCPGNLVGVWHEDGLGAACRWINENPGWREKYQKQETAK